VALAQPAAPSQDSTPGANASQTGNQGDNQAAGTGDTTQKPAYDPYKTFSDAYKQMVKDSGMLEIKSEFERVQKEYAELARKESEEVLDVNDNPWLSEGLRQKRISKINDKYQSQKDAATRQMDLYQGLYDSAKQDAQFQATQATNMAHDQAVLDQNMTLAQMDAAEKLLASQKGTADIQEYEYAKKQGYTGTFTQYKKEQANLKIDSAGTGNEIAAALGISAKDYNAFNTAFQDVYEKVLSGTNAINTREKAGQAMIARYPQYADAIWKVIYGGGAVSALFPDGYESLIKSSTSNINPTTGLNTNLSPTVKGNVEALKSANATLEDIKAYIRASGYDPESNEAKLLLSGYQTGSASTSNYKPTSMLLYNQLFNR
jgi:hypothetical protein